MPLDDCIARHTHRQLKMWMRYLQEEEEKPDKVCYYLIQLTAEVRRFFLKKGKKLKLSDFILKFRGKKTKLTKQQKELNEQYSRSNWGLLTGTRANSENEEGDDQ